MREQQPQQLPGEAAPPLEIGHALLERIDNSPLVGDGPHLWIGTVRDYHAGAPHGRWFDAAQPLDSLQYEIADMAARSPTAHDAGPVDWHVFAQRGFGRHEPPLDASLPEMARRAQQYNEDVRAYRAWARVCHDNPTWLSRFEGVYAGRFDRFHDWVVLEVERAGYDKLLDRVVPDTIRPHVEIDIASLAHELLASGNVATARDREQGGVFVFRASSFEDSPQPLWNEHPSVE